jgi:hypothetical protein
VTVRNARAAVVATIVGLLVIGLSAGPADAASPRVPKDRSGLRWASGVFVTRQVPSGHDKFGTWRRAKTDIALTYTGRSTWTEIVKPAWLYAYWQQAPQTLVITAPMFPEKSRYSLAACAKGSYDSQWRAFGANAAKSGMAARTIVRLGWEFNGSWQPWAARNPAHFVSCWRRIFTAAESRAPALRWDWTVNRGDSDVMSDARDAWPGRKYVDIVGIDSYDGWPGVLRAADWNAHYAGAWGLKFWADFARRKGKRLSVPEWGLYPGTAWAGHNGGDNPLYIRRMFGFFKEQRGNLAYEAYFNDEDPAHASALDSANPRGAAEYRRQIAAARAPRR